MHPERTVIRPMTSLTAFISTLGDTFTMSILGKRLRHMAFFLVGLLSVVALSLGTIMAEQAFATKIEVWGTGTAVTTVSPRTNDETASSHLEPNFYQ